MKEALVSTVSRNVVLNCIREQKRLDCRALNETRKIKIDFRQHPGCVSVTFGRTCVIAQVSCRITKPKESRPCEGHIRIHVDLTKIPLMNLEQWKHQEFAQEINSILEQNIRHAGCIDLESLCINAGELVWSIKVDIVVLNNCGNILDCASIAALCALYHYRVPEVSVHGSSVRVYGHNERKPRPLRVLHFPLNVMFAFFCDGRFTVIDPSDEEEKVMDGFVAVAMNTHNEICGIKLSGKLGLRKDQIEVCKQIAYSKTAELTDIIRHAVNDYYKKGEAVVNHHLCTDREDENRDSNDEKNEIMTKTNVDEAAISLLLMPAMNRLSVSQDDNSDIDRSISFPEPDLNQLQEEFIEPITPIELTTAEENKSIHVLPNDESWPIAVEIRSNSTRKNECDIVDVVSIIADTLNWIVGEIEASYISNKTGNYIIDHDLTGESKNSTHLFLI